MSDVAPSNHAGGRGTHGEGKESATADDDREGMRRKISSNHGLEAKNPGFRYHSSLNLIVLLYGYGTRRGSGYSPSVIGPLFVYCGLWIRYIRLDLLR